MMTLRFRHEMAYSAEAVWRLIDDPRQLIPASLPLLYIRPLSPMPDKIFAGLSVPTRLMLFRFLPWGSHTVDFKAVDAHHYSFSTEERGANIRSWCHDFRIEPRGEGRCVCYDTIRFDAGILAGVVWAFSQLLYRWRYVRRRQLLAAQG